MKISIIIILALLAFAANSILARLALTESTIDPYTFTTLRLASGAIVLMIVVRLRRWWMHTQFQAPDVGQGSVVSALALLAYALLFSMAYVSLTAATGALLLFGTVQISMMAWALVEGEKLRASALLGFALALGGLVWLLMPGLARPPVLPALMMIGSGLAWAVYTLRARVGGDPTASTAGNFLIASVPAFVIAIAMMDQSSWDRYGVGLAVVSGALTSGLGYVLWYAALAHIKTQTAAIAQLQVPVITALAGVLVLSEPLSLRLVLAGLIILGGILLVISPWSPRI